MSNNNTELPDPRDFIFDPSSTGAVGVEALTRIQQQKHRMMPLGLRKIREYFSYIMGGELIGVLAQTHNGKSMFLTMWEELLAKHLIDTGRDEVIVHIDTEMSIQSLAISGIAMNTKMSLFDMVRGNVRDWGDIYNGAKELGKVPIYRIAANLGTPSPMELTLSNIGRMLTQAQAGKVIGREIKIAAVFVDYLQALPFDREGLGANKDDRRLQVRRDVYRLREMANVFDCPVIMGVQAKQNLTGALGPNMRLPGMYDPEETSAVAQRVDRLLSLWMPKTTHSVGEYIQHKNIEFEVTEDLMWIRVLKQRLKGLPSGRSWMGYWDFQNYKFDIPERPPVG